MQSGPVLQDLHRTPGALQPHAPVYDNLGSASNMEKDGSFVERSKNGRECVGFVLWKWGFSVSCLRKLAPMAGWVEGDATDLPFSDGHFDAITMGFGLRNVVDKYKAMEEMFRVLKAGSRVPILDFNKSTNPVVSAVQELMIDNLVVPVASGFGLEEDYKYLKSSVRAFLTGDELEKLALDVGFSNARYYEIGGSLMGNLVATR